MLYCFKINSQEEYSLKITVLTENTTEKSNIDTEHGLSLYIETENHKILFDMGQSELFEKNAEKLGVDISAVDLAALSHGHYDHGGGIARFLKINGKAPIYISKHAFEPHYSGTEKYIGLDTSLCDDRFLIVDDYLQLDNGLELFSCNQKKRKYPTNSYGLNMIENDNMLEDDFRHEQYLLITENENKILISGCSHKGILNIVEWFEPDVLIGGFHFMKLDPTVSDDSIELKNSAELLKSFDTIYYTCHCTGTEQYNYIKKYMGDKVNYLSCGKEIIL